MSSHAIQRVGLRRRGRVWAFVVVGALGAALGSSPAVGQAISLEELNKSGEYQSLLFLSCSSMPSHTAPPRDGIVDRFAAFQTRTRLAPRDTEPLHLAFLLEPPFACTPRVDGLFSRSLDELAALSDAEFAALGVSLKTNPAERTGTFEERKEFDRQVQRQKTRFAELRPLLLERRWEAAYILLGEVGFISHDTRLLALAQLLLTTTDPEAQQYGRRCLDRIEGDVYEIAQADMHLLAGALALKERRWADAGLHYRQALNIIAASNETSPEEKGRRLREVYLSLTYIAERRGNHEQSLRALDLAIGLDEHDAEALLHRGVNYLLMENRRETHDFNQVRKWYDDAYNEFARRETRSPLPAVSPPLVLVVEVEARLNGYTPALIGYWESLSVEWAGKGQLPELAAQFRLKSAEVHAARSNPTAAAGELAEAEKLDPDRIKASPRRRQLLFALSDPTAVQVLGERFFAVPTDQDAGRMLSLALLDSAEPHERARGAAIAGLLYRGDPDSPPLIVAAAAASFKFGRNEEALRLIEPLVGLGGRKKLEFMVTDEKPDELKYELEARGFSPFDQEHQVKAWLISQANDPMLTERRELKASPLVIEPPETESPAPVNLSGDDAYLVARILIRTADVKSPERITRAMALLDRAMAEVEAMRYRDEAQQLRKSVANLLPAWGIDAKRIHTTTK